MGIVLLILFILFIYFFIKYLPNLLGIAFVLFLIVIAFALIESGIEYPFLFIKYTFLAIAIIIGSVLFWIIGFSLIMYILLLIGFIIKNTTKKVLYFLKFTKSPYIYSKNIMNIDNNKSKTVEKVYSYMIRKNKGVINNKEILTIKNYSTFLFYYFIYFFSLPILNSIIIPLLNLKNSIRDSVKEYLNRWKK